MKTYRVWLSGGTALLVNAETETDARASKPVCDAIYGLEGVRVLSVELVSEQFSPNDTAE